MATFELRAYERHRSASERDSERQGCFDISGVTLTGPTPAAHAMSFELSQKKRQNGKPGEQLGGLFDPQDRFDLHEKKNQETDSQPDRDHWDPARYPYQCPTCGTVTTKKLFDEDPICKCCGETIKKKEG